MTTRAERTRAVLQAKRFLAWVATNCKEPYWMVPPSGSVPKKVRDEASRILRHFPMGVELIEPTAFDVDEIKKHYAPPDEKVPDQGRLFDAPG